MSAQPEWFTTAMKHCKLTVILLAYNIDVTVMQQMYYNVLSSIGCCLAMHLLPALAMHQSKSRGRNLLQITGATTASHMQHVEQNVQLHVCIAACCTCKSNEDCHGAAICDS